MRKHILKWYAGSLSAAVSLAAFAPYALACAGVPRPGENVRIAEESAIILWDKARGVEHFIRSASFDTSAKNFGFLVPTPTTPTLTQANSDAFSLLEGATLPKHVRHEQKGVKFFWWLAARNKSETAMPVTGASMPKAVAAEVRVLSKQTVAGYDAVVLEADNVAALKSWLAAHSYDARPALMEWLAPYVAAHWKITAFKISASQAASESIVTSPVRMSFQTPAPFFPYREPADQNAGRASGNYKSPSRLLRVFYIGNERAEGKFGNNLRADQLPWTGNTKWSDTLSRDVCDALLEDVKLNAGDMLALPRWMTVFEDNASPRSGTDDVYFSPTVNQQAVTPPPIEDTVDERVSVPVEGAVLAAGVAAFFLVRGLRRRKPLV